MSKEDRLVVGVDLGGTQTRLAIICDDIILFREKFPTPVMVGPQIVIQMLTQSIQSLIYKAHIPVEHVHGVGISMAGPLNSHTGIVFETPNLYGWKNIPLQDLLTTSLNIPVALGNDANLAALAEYQFGSGRGVKDMIYITVSTGIGAGIIIDGKLLEGASGMAGEVGHMYLDLHESSPYDGAGHQGCLEAFASGTAIAREASSLIAQGKGMGIKSYIEHNELNTNEESITAIVVERAAQAGDPEAQQIMQQAIYALGMGCASLVHCFNPERIVLGGGVTNSRLLISKVRDIVATHTFARASQAVEIVPAQLNDDAGILGAAAFIQQRLL